MPTVIARCGPAGLITLAVMCPGTTFAADPEPAPSFGWEWLDPPRTLPTVDRLRDGAVTVGPDSTTIVDSTSNGALRIRVMALRGDLGQHLPDQYQGVAFDERRERLVASVHRTIFTRGFVYSEFHFQSEVLESRRITYVGVEVLRLEGRRKLAERARERAKSDGIQALPFPELGGPYEFELTALDGRSLRSRDLKGKVVLLDCWATWCGSCMAKMPELRKLYESRHAAGFEVVGINFDESVDQARRAIQVNKLNWPHVHVPGDKAIRDLWFEASSVSDLPRLFLVDREGVLRGDLTPDDLGRAISEAMERGPEPSSATSPKTASEPCSGEQPMPTRKPHGD